MSFGGKQLTPHYHAQLDTSFLDWYLHSFRNTRMAYGHWEVCGLHTVDAAYHQVIDLDGKGRATLVSNTPIHVDLGAHTWERNENSFAIAFAGFDDAQTTGIGRDVATPDMIRLFIHTLAMDLCVLRAPVGNFLTHGEAANNEDQGPHPPYLTPGCSGDDALPYGNLVHEGPHACERWDLKCRIDPTTLRLYAFEQPVPAGIVTEDFGDYIRGQAILLIQEMTRAHWDPSTAGKGG